MAHTLSPSSFTAGSIDTPVMADLIGASLVKNKLLSTDILNSSLLGSANSSLEFRNIENCLLHPRALSSSSKLVTESSKRLFSSLSSSLKKGTEGANAKDAVDNRVPAKPKPPCSWFKHTAVCTEVIECAPSLLSSRDTCLPRFLPVLNFTSPLDTEYSAHVILKSDLLQLVAASLSGDLFAMKSEVRSLLAHLLNSISIADPEFIFKAAVYCRRELNIRTTSNLLIAYGCFTKSCHPFVDKYFSAVIRLPSDWVEVAEYYEALCTMHGKKPSYPKVLRRSMIRKFSEFDEYQLAKYNRKKSRLSRKRKMAVKSRDVPSQPFSDCEPSLQINPVPVTFQYLIRLLHIHRPTYSVMCLLGKVYPNSASDFFKAGLDGVWDSALSGTRMKLPIPFTWETELSKSQNTRSAWEKLIFSGKLPYMAMLRNLRNIIKCGVSLQAHNEVIKKLTNPHAVINSHQFPFRFFSAYAILDQLERLYLDGGIPFRRRGRSIKTLTPALRRKESKRTKVVPLAYSLDLLTAYQLALNIAIDISIRHSLSPIRGSTLIICSVQDKPNKTCIPRGMGSDLRTIGILLGMMCATCCESCSMYISQSDGTNLIPLQQCMRYDACRSVTSEESILWTVYSLCADRCSFYQLTVQDLVENLCSAHQQFRTIFLIGPMLPELSLYVTNYRRTFGPINAIWGDLEGTDKWPEAAGDRKDWTIMKGTTDMVLRYIAEASDKSLLERVERIDELYGLTGQTHVELPKWKSAQPDVPLDRPLNEWRSCRIFISSTFRDMHAERDLLCGVIIPSIRQFAAQELRVHVEEVDLRWGVPELATRSPRALEMCLEHAATADIFVLLVGGRYGWVPKPAILDGLSEPLLSQVKKIHRPGMSVTELEYCTAKQAIMLRIPPHLKRKGDLNEKEAVTRRVFAFVRDSKSLKSVPDVHLPDFKEQHADKYNRLQAFISVLKKDGVVVSERYPALFNGVVANRPVMGNLNQFVSELTECLRNALREHFKPQVPESSMDQLKTPTKALTHDMFLATYVSPIACSISPRQLLDLKKAFLELDLRGKQCHTLRSFAGQKNVLSTERSSVVEHRTESDGAILLITGSHGSGKTTHLAALAMLLRYPHWHPQQFSRDSPAKTATILNPTTLHSLHTLSFDPHAHTSSLTGYIVLLHFVEGVAASGLPPKVRLISLLDDWSSQLIHCAELLSQYFPILESKLHGLKANSSEKNVDTRTSGASLDSFLRSKITLFTELLKLFSMFPNMRYAFMVDAVDHLQPFTLDWLPEVLPENVRFIFSCEANSAAARQLASRPDCLAFTISGLNLMERKAAIRVLFGRYGKILRETTFGNQLSVLANKRNAELPLYLRLACDELRLHGTYEELDYQLKALPSTLPSLVQHVIARAEAEYGSRITRALLAFICCSRRPLKTEELHMLLDIWLVNSNPLPDEPDIDGSSSWSFLNCKTYDFSDARELLEKEKFISQLLFSNWSMQTKPIEHRGHLPSLAFTVLLRCLSPLFAGFGDRSDDLRGDEEQPVANEAFSLHCLVRYRSEEIASLVQEIAFRRVDRLNPSSLLGIHNSTAVTRFGPKRFKSEERSNTEELHELNKESIHWLLATELTDLRDIIHHFICAGKLPIVHHLLTSVFFLAEKVHAGLGDSIIEDFEECASRESELQLHLKLDDQIDPTRDRLRSMLSFIGANLPFLTRYPFLFAELCINNRSSSWIHQLGFVYLALSKTFNEVGSKTRLLIRHSHASDYTDESKRLAPTCIQSPVPTGGQNIDSPTVVAIAPGGHFMVYGSESGAITVVELKTLRVLRSLFGHRSAVLCLCFLLTEEYSRKFHSDPESLSPGSKFKLSSTAQDGSVYLWDIAVDLNSFGKYEVTTGVKLLSLSGSHRSAVTTCAWHPRKHILLTGGLDCQIILWTLPTILDDLANLQYDTHATLPPHKRISDGLGPVSTAAFRLPSSSGPDQPGCCKSLDVLAIGSWDGTVRIFDIVNWKYCKKLRVSNSAISSLAYSPDGGTVLATQDVAGQLLLWNSDTYSLLSGITAYNTALPSDPASNSLDPSVCLHGQVCFSQPHGQYLIQSGGVNDRTGRISVWNAQLGSYLGPWKDSRTWRLGAQSSPEITSFCIDPFGHIMAAGTNDGVFTLVCALSSTILYSSDLPTTETERSSLQICCCDVIINDLVNNMYTLLLVLGFASGLVQVFTAEVLLPSTFDTLNMSADCACRLSAVKRLCSSFYHSGAAAGAAVAYGGGTLCAAVKGSVIASGGGDGSCHLTFFHASTDNTVTLGTSMKLPELQSAVTAVALSESLLAVGTKLRLLKIYSVTKHSMLTPFCPDAVNATNDWITALAWAKHSSIRNYLLVGSNDHMVRLYAITFANTPQLLDIVDGPGGLINCLSLEDRYVAAGSSEGTVRIWRRTMKDRLEHVSRLEFGECSSSGSKLKDGNVGRIVNLRLFAAMHSTNLSDYTETTMDNLTAFAALPFMPTANDELDISTDLEDPQCASKHNLPHDGADDEDVEDSEDEVYEISPPDVDGEMSAECTTAPQDALKHADISQIMTTIRCLSKQRRPCILSVGQNRSYLSSQAQIASSLRLVVGQHVTPPRGGQKHPGGVLRFRFLAPLLPECRAQLDGHPASIATGLAACDPSNSGWDSLLVSVAAREGSCDGILGHDIRYWRLPSPGDNASVSSLQHSGNITCLGGVQLSNANNLLLSGGADGFVLLWRSTGVHSSETMNHAFSPPNSFQQASLASFFKIIFGSPVTALVTTSSAQSFTIYVAADKRVWCVTIPEKSLPILKQWSSLSISMLQKPNHAMNLKEKLSVESVLVSSSVLGICLLESSCSDENVDLLLSLCNGELAVVSFKRHEACPTTNLRMLTTANEPIGHWLLGCHEHDRRIVALHKGAPVTVSLGADEFTMLPLFPTSALCPQEVILTISSVCSIYQGEVRNFYLLTTRTDDETKLKLFSANGAFVAQSEPILTPLMLTASCHLPANNGSVDSASHLLNFVMATSDGLLLVLELNILEAYHSNEKTMRNIAVYPTGEYITNLQPLADKPLHFLTGSKSGRVDIYALV